MKKHTLISLSDRVDEVVKGDWSRLEVDPIVLVAHYNKFLKTDLLSNYFYNGKEYHFLNRFVPCDLSGRVIQEPVWRQPGNEQYEGAEFDTYQHHLSKVWFEGFSVRDFGEWKRGKHIYGIHISDQNLNIAFSKCTQGWLPIGQKTISDLTSLNLTLTPFAAKRARYE